MRKLLTILTFVAAITVTQGLRDGSRAEAAEYMDYFGENLLDLGIFQIYHRIGCHSDDVNVNSNTEFDGFSLTNACDAGWPWHDPSSYYGFDYLGSHYAGSVADAEARKRNVDAKYGCSADSQNCSCGYNVLTDCNSDCWIREYGRQYGVEISICSPCSGNSISGFFGGLWNAVTGKCS